MIRLVLLIVWAVLLISCGSSTQEKESTSDKKYHGWGFSWENDSTLVQYFGTRVCTTKVDRETYTGILVWFPNGHSIYNVPLKVVVDTFYGEMDSLTMWEVADSIKERIE